MHKDDENAAAAASDHDTGSGLPSGHDGPGGMAEGVSDANGGPPPSRRRWILAAMGALAVALFAVPLLQGPDDHGLPAGESNAASNMAASAGGTDACPAKATANLDFTLTGMDGVKVRLSDYKGRIIVLNFWATWCGPCKVEIPDFVDVYTRYRDRGVVVLGVLNLDEPSDEELRGFATQYKMNYPVFRANEDFSDANGPIYGLPTTLVINREGSICSRHMGLVSKETVEGEIKRLL